MVRQHISSTSVQNQVASPRPRGRPRAYDPGAALAAATAAFWQAGYTGTSLDALTDATGMNRPSLYGAFGDKRSLYLQALRAYADASREALRAALAPPRPLREGLRRVFDTALKLYYPPQQPARGCFLIGTAATESLQDDAVRELLQGALRGFDAEFEHRFRQALAAGELRPDADPVLLARLASALLHTLALRSRAGDARAQLAATAAAGIEQLLR